MANRITSISIDCAASRLPARGARPAGIGQGEVRSHVLTDPGGNEFCPLRPLCRRGLSGTAPGPAGPAAARLSPGTPIPRPVSGAARRRSGHSTPSFLMTLRHH